MAEKKALMLASVASMIDQFNMSNIGLLLSLGYRVDVVADYTNPGNISAERSRELIQRLEAMGTRAIDIPIPRSLNPGSVASAYKEVKKLITAEHYDLIHCHSPIGGAITRVAAKKERKNGTRVIYTAHGFHFYTGAPMQNWLLFYPVEKVCSRWTDILITINKEDFDRAKKKFRIKQIEYVPGVGIDVAKFSDDPTDKGQKRKELMIPEESFVLLSVGELNTNKNHQIVIKALGKLQNQNIHYVIAGKGDLKETLETLAADLNMKDDLHLLGYRTDIPSLYKMADAFILPSVREGLNVSLMEAMASGLPCLASRIRGNVDLIEQKYTFDPMQEQETADKIFELHHSDRMEIIRNNQAKSQAYDFVNINRMMKQIYENK